jgi:hypothetical protein
MAYPLVGSYPFVEELERNSRAYISFCGKSSADMTLFRIVKSFHDCDDAKLTLSHWQKKPANIFDPPVPAPAPHS